MTGPRSTDKPDVDIKLPPEFDQNLAVDISAVIDPLQTLGYQLRQVSGMQVDDYKYNCENVLRDCSRTLDILADRVRDKYAPTPTDG